MVETTPPSVITLNVCIALSLKYANAQAFLGFKLTLVFLSAFSAFEELLHSTCYRHQKRNNKHLMHLHAFANRLLSVHVEKGFWSEFCSRSCLYIFLSSRCNVKNWCVCVCGRNILLDMVNFMSLFCISINCAGKCISFITIFCPLFCTYAICFYLAFTQSLWNKESE